VIHAQEVLLKKYLDIIQVKTEMFQFGLFF
jgi:hypothetical protein